LLAAQEAPMPARDPRPPGRPPRPPRPTTRPPSVFGDSALDLEQAELMRSSSALGAYLRRQRSRLGAPKAITATAHKLARIVYHLVRYGAAYVKETEAAYAEQVRARLEKQLQRRARELGFEVKKIEPAAVAEED
jgi:hypothetical protein